MRIRIHLAMTIALFASSVMQTANAQVPRTFLPAGPADWYNTANWSDNLVPTREFSEFGQINMSRYAYVDTPRANTTFDGVDADPGAVELQVQGSIGTGAILEVRDGGTFRVQFDSGTPDLTDGGVDVGSPNGTGLLRVLPGGSMTVDGQLGVSFTALPNPPSSVTVGDLAGSPGVATLNAGSGSVNGIMQPFSNSDLNFSDFLTFAGAATFRPEIRSASNAQVDVVNNAALDGALIVDFTDFTPTPGQTWTILDAGTISGEFDSITSPVIGLGEALIPSIGTNSGRRQYNVTYSTAFVLTVNRDTGAMAITNPNAPNIEFDLYGVHSASGRLNPSQWTSLDDGNLLGGDWRESNPTTNDLIELKQDGLGSFAGNGSFSLGNIYNPLAAPFLTGDDVTFDYANSTGAIVDGQIVYTGSTFNNLVLRVDPTTGFAILKNTSATTVSIDGYDIESPSGSLIPANWNSFEDRGIDGGDWFESSISSPNRLLELKQDGATILSPGESYNLGTIFSGGMQDLDFDFLQTGEAFADGGIVHYRLAADFDGDDDVDGDDLTKWEMDYGVNGGSDADGDGDSDGSDFLVWQQQFGMGLPLVGSIGAAQAVPEPNSLALALAFVGLLGGSRRRVGGR